MTETLRIFCKVCNKGLTKTRLIIMDAYDQLQFAVDHFKETGHNDFGVEIGKVDLSGSYSKALEAAKKVKRV